MLYMYLCTFILYFLYKCFHSVQYKHSQSGSVKGFLLSKGNLQFVHSSHIPEDPKKHKSNNSSKLITQLMNALKCRTLATEMLH